MTHAIGADIWQMMAQARYDRADHMRATRFFLLRRLRMAGVTEVVCTYDAYADSGNWEDVTLDCGRITPPEDLRDALGDFAWDVAYHHHPGFENNEGGYGEMTWDIIADAISLDHADRFVDTSHSYHEGI